MFIYPLDFDGAKKKEKEKKTLSRITAIVTSLNALKKENKNKTKQNLLTHLMTKQPYSMTTV